MGYPELSAVVGVTVPDYRGRFLRHVGGNSAALGVAQGDAIRNITAKIWSNEKNLEASFLGDSAKKCSGAFFESENYFQGGLRIYDTRYSLPGALTFDASRVVPVAIENRPANMAVKYIVFAGD